MLGDHLGHEFAFENLRTPVAILVASVWLQLVDAESVLTGQQKSGEQTPDPEP